MTLRPAIALVAMAPLAGCRTTTTAGCVDAGYTEDPPAPGACARSGSSPSGYVNRSYGNCGHCAGNAER